MDGGSVVQGMEQATPEDRTLERQPQPSEEEEEKQRELLEKHRKCLCSEFASVSGSDTAIAQCYLAENEWDMQRALNSYFEPPLEEQHVERHTLPVVESLVDLTDDSTTDSVAAAVKEAGLGSREDDSTFSLITWNIDGLDLNNMQDRARGICSYIALYNPDVVFLQEVIPPVFNYLQKRAVSYTIIPGNTDGYFTVILIKKSRVRVLKHEITPFPTTSMMRNLLAVHATISGNELCLMTSHLESTKNHSEERLNQLKLVLAKMMEVPESTTVIFGGDTNLRDKEVAKLGGLPNNVLDIWEFLGKPEHCCYTWDTSQNTNLDARYKCKLRFDRLFLRAASAGGQIIPQSLDLIGLEKLDCGRFPSDHWGLLCNFAVIL
ncbi:tyrosyl-DNA phosphodiesterase 2 isoform X1 [Rhineura floridana]|uniref:tyrosyl-DNA phosphodiesterase 2 isoform X1 n=1 Tax=Rhineura floridana TaxID=261503 RepID=UPI002AC8450A|nr:tyrosyl-DNA phosphodiesterase 2 isoform X1 [Rhineura floridana]